MQAFFLKFAHHALRARRRGLLLSFKIAVSGMAFATRARARALIDRDMRPCGALPLSGSGPP